MPIQAYFLTREQDQVVHRAAQRLVEPCMKAQGFDIGLPDQLQPAADHHQPDFLDRRYDAVYDEATARKYGYHLPFQVDVPTLPPNDPRMTEAAMTALFGEDSEKHSAEEVNVSAGRTGYGGCLGKAEAQLAAGMSYASFKFWAQPVRLLALDDTPRSDPGLAAAQAEWSTCMSEKGYQVATTIGDDNRRPRLDLTTPTPSRAEIAMALWDVACQKRTRVVQIAFEVEVAYERTKIDEQAEVFAQIRDENALLVERAAELLGEDVP